MKPIKVILTASLILGLNACVFGVDIGEDNNTESETDDSAQAPENENVNDNEEQNELSNSTSAEFCAVAPEDEGDGFIYIEPESFEVGLMGFEASDQSDVESLLEGRLPLENIIHISGPSSAREAAENLGFTEVNVGCVSVRSETSFYRFPTDDASERRSLLSQIRNDHDGTLGYVSVESLCGCSPRIFQDEIIIGVETDGIEGDVREALEAFAEEVISDIADLGAFELLRVSTGIGYIMIRPVDIVGFDVHANLAQVMSRLEDSEMVRYVEENGVSWGIDDGPSQSCACVQPATVEDSEENLCAATGGRMVLSSCGDAPVCGDLSSECFSGPEPGGVARCNCGFMKNYVSGVGCVEDPSCYEADICSAFRCDSDAECLGTDERCRLIDFGSVSVGCTSCDAFRGGEMTLCLTDAAYNEMENENASSGPCESGGKTFWLNASITNQVPPLMCDESITCEPCVGTELRSYCDAREECMVNPVCEDMGENLNDCPSDEHACLPAENECGEGSRNCECIDEYSVDIGPEVEVQCIDCQGVSCTEGEAEPFSLCTNFPCINGAYVLEACDSDGWCEAQGLSSFCGRYSGENNVCVLHDDI